MANYFPTYRRNESLVGYSQRCASGRDITNAVPSPSARLEMCKEHAEEVREFQPKQPFSKPKKIVSPVRSQNG